MSEIELNTSQVKLLDRKSSVAEPFSNNIPGAKLNSFGVSSAFTSELKRLSDLNEPVENEDKSTLRVPRLTQIFETADPLKLKNKSPTNLHNDDEDQDARRNLLDEYMHPDQQMMEFLIRRNKQVLQELNLDVEQIKDEEIAKKTKFARNRDFKSCFPLFKENDSWRFYWDMTILIIAIWNSIMIPVAEFFVPPWASSTWYLIIDEASNVAFLNDILIQFNTIYYDIDGEEVHSRKQISCHYLGGSFALDLVSSLPISRFGFGSQWRLLSILKVVRITRLTRMVNKLSFDETTKAYIKIIKLIFYLFLGMHILGCFWYFIVNLDKVWLPALDFIWASMSMVYRFWDDTMCTMTYQYLVCFYSAVIALGGNEMGPRTKTEIALMILLLIMLAIVNASVFGEMTVLVQEASRKSTAFQEQVDVANTAMKNINLPKETQVQVREYLLTTQGTHHEQEELKKFIDMISPDLKEDVAVSIFSQVLKKNKRLSTLVHDIAQYKTGPKGSQVKQKQIENFYVGMIVSRMTTVFVQPDDVVIDQFEKGQAMYLIAKGECKVIVGDEPNSKEKKKDKIMYSGQYFGEISLIYNCLTTAKVIGKKYSTLARLDITNFKAVSQQIPRFQEALQIGIYEYDDRMLRFIKRSLNKLPYFKEIDDDIRYDLIFALKTTHFQKYQILQKPGDDATSLFFIQQGVIQVYTMFDQEEFVFERLFRGSIINYRTFFMEQSAFSYMKCLTAAVMLELPYPVLERIVAKHPAFNKTFATYRMKQMKIGKGIPLDFIMSLPSSVQKKLFTNAKQRLIMHNREKIDTALLLKKGEYRKAGLQMSINEEQEFIQEQINDTKVAQHLRRANELENMLKNVVIGKLEQIREIKNRKSLKESVEEIVRRQNQEQARKRSKLKKLILNEYENNQMERFGDNDGLYNRVQLVMDRMLKSLCSHSQAIDALERKLNIISSKMPKPQYRQAQNQQSAFDENPYADNDQQNNGLVGRNNLGRMFESEGQNKNARNTDDKMFNTQDFFGEKASQLKSELQDDVIDVSAEERNRTLMDELIMVHAKPNQLLMRNYQLPIDDMSQFEMNQSKMEDVSSDDNEEGQDD